MGSEASIGGNIDVNPWLKSLPVAPEYHPTLSEFQDPISYIFKIEKEASKFGICKIVPPVSQPSKKSILANFNNSLLAREPQYGPTFTTRQQQVGFCPRKHRPVRKPVWQSGERYNLSEFETKAKNFEKVYLRNYAKKVLNPLEIETLYWNATVDKPFSVEYANDMPGSAFSVRKSGGKKSEIVMNVVDTEWNMRGVSRANASLLKFMKEEIPGVTSPMVYVAMMFSWFAWHVEDHDLHSLNYLHMGASKTWYGVPRDAAFAFEDVIREHGYCGEINPLVTFATLGEKTTVMSPEVLLSAGVPCCRLVQNAGDFVVTFPRAYHSGFSHGFNCGEAANIATPEWLRVAKEAAIRRASINCPPMVSHFQLLYDLTLSLYSRVSKGITMEPRSSRLKDKKKSEGEMLIKELFFQDMVQNNEKLHVLGKGSSVVLLSQSSISNSICSNSLLRQQLTAKSNLFPSLCSPDLELTTAKYNSHGDFMVERDQEIEQTINAKVSLCSGNNIQDMSSYMKKISEKGLFSCVTCGILCFTCVAILQPTEDASRNLMSADSCKFDDDWGVSVNDPNCNYTRDTNAPNMNPYSVLELLKNQDGLYSIPISSAHQVTNVDKGKGSSVGTVSNSRVSNGPSSLNLLALAYGNSSDSEAEADIPENHIPEINSGTVTFQQFSGSDARDRDSQSLDSSDEFRTDNCSAIEMNSLTPHRFRHENQLQSDTLRFTDGDSSRLHVFCLEHAVQVEKRLSSIGGAHILLVCHPDFPKLESQAKKVSEELESQLSWNNISFREATQDDENMIRLALHSENAIHGNGDWAVKLGINLFYSANLSRSPLYCKQMPYNSIIYNAFGRGLENESDKKVSSRQRKIVMAGKWCGKVWMSNQVHPLLVKKDFEEEEQNFGVELGIKPDLVYERRVEGNLTLEMGKTSRKRKIGAENVLPLKESSETQNEGEIRQDFAFGKKYNRTRRMKQVKKEFRQVEHLDSSSEEVEHSELPKNIKGKRGGKRLKGEMESLEEYLKKNPLSNSWKVITGKNGSRRIKETIPDAEQCEESSEEFQTVNSPKKIDENFDESSDEILLCDSWNQIKSKAKRKKMDTTEKSVRAEKPLDDELVGGPSTRLRKRKTKLCKDSVTKSVNVKPVLKQRPKERITKKVVSTNSNSARIRDEEGEYQCDMEGCTMSFGSKNELSVHKQNLCPVKGCGKKFFSHKYLVQHRRVHEDYRPLKCPWKGCKMTFKWAWARTEHIRVNTGARPYVCTQLGCGQTFRFVSDFSRHKRKTGHAPKKSKGK